MPQHEEIFIKLLHSLRILPDAPNECETSNTFYLHSFPWFED